MWLGYFSCRTRHYVCVVCSLFLNLLERCFPGSPVSLIPQKNLNFFKLNSIGNPRTIEDCYVLPSLNQIDVFHVHFNLYAYYQLCILSLFFFFLKTSYYFNSVKCISFTFFNPICFAFKILAIDCIQIFSILEHFSCVYIVSASKHEGAQRI